MKFVGDGCFSVFDDADAGAAVSCARGLQASVRALGYEFSVELELRTRGAQPLNVGGGELVAPRTDDRPAPTSTDGWPADVRVALVVGVSSVSPSVESGGSRLPSTVPMFLPLFLDFFAAFFAIVRDVDLIDSSEQRKERVRLIAGFAGLRGVRRRC